MVIAKAYESGSSRLARSENELQITSSIDWWHNNDQYVSLTISIL